MTDIDFKIYYFFFIIKTLQYKKKIENLYLIFKITNKPTNKQIVLKSFSNKNAECIFKTRK